MGQGDAGVGEDGEGDTCVKLGPVECDLEEGAKLGGGSNMLEELESPTDALLIIEMAIADSEESSRAKDHCLWSFRTASSLGKAC